MSQPSLRLMTKARAYKVANQKGSSGVTFCAPRSAKECEGANPHTPKLTPIMGVRVPNGFSNLHNAIVGVKTHWFEEFFISLEIY
jgi:hypothetical protein